MLLLLLFLTWLIVCHAAWLYFMCWCCRAFADGSKYKFSATQFSYRCFAIPKTELFAEVWHFFSLCFSFILFAKFVPLWFPFQLWVVFIFNLMSKPIFMRLQVYRRSSKISWRCTILCHRPKINSCLGTQHLHCGLHSIYSGAQQTWPGPFANVILEKVEKYVSE